MTTQEGRANELYFILRYGYNVPEDILDKIDLYAYADPHLTVTENLRILLNYFPALRSYVDLSRLYDAERYAYEWRSYLTDVLRRALEGDTMDMEMLGFTDSEEFARTLIEEGIITEEEYERMKREVSVDPWAEFVDWFIGRLRNVPLTYPVPIVSLGELYEKAQELGITATADELAERLEREKLARKVPRRGYVIPLWLEEDEKCDTLECLQAVRQALAVAVLADRAEGRDRERYLQAVAQFCHTYRWPMPEPLDRSIIYLYQKYGDGLTWADLIDRHSFCDWVKSLGFGAAGGEIIKEAEEILREAEELRVQPYLNMIRAGYAQLKAAVEHGELEQAREILNTMRGHLERARKYRKGGYGALTDAEKRGLMSGAVMVIDRVADDLVGRIQRILLARGERPRVMKEKDRSKYPDEYTLRIHSPIADITLRARIVREREGGAVEYSMEGIVEEGEYGCRETISFSTTDRREFEERAGNELVRAWEKVQECAAARGSVAREISKEFEELDKEGERVHKVAFKALGRAKNAVETIEGKLRGEVSVEELKEMERKIVRSLDEVHDASNKLVAFKEWVEKTAEDLKRKYPAEAEFIESLKDTILRKHNVEGLLSALGERAGDLTRLLDEVRIEMRERETCNVTPYITFVPRDNGVLIKRVDFGDPRKGTAPAVLKILERLNLSYDRPTFYIFEGPLLAYNRLKYEKFVPNGTYLLLSRGTGSWRHPETTVYLLQVRGGKVCELVKARWPEEWMEFIDEVKKYVPSEVRPQEQVEEVREEEAKPPETPEEARPEERAEARGVEEVPETLQFIKHKLTSAFKAKLLDLGVPREEWDEYVRRAEKAIEFDASAVYHGKVPQEVAMLGVMQMAEKLVKGEPVKAGPVEVRPPEEAVEKSRSERAAELTRRLMEYVRQKYPDYDIYLRSYVKDLAAELAKEPGSISDLFEEGKARVDEYVGNSKPVLDVAAELGLTAPEFEALLEKVRENLVSFLMLPESEKKKALKAWAEKITQPKPRKAEIRYRAEEIWRRRALPEEEGPKVKPSEELFEGLPELTKKPPERVPVKDIADILAEPENLVQILVFGLNYWLGQASKRIPGLKAVPYDEVISALTAILNRALRNLENPTTLVDWLAYTVLSKFMASAMEGLTSLWKAAWPDIRVELRAMAIEGDPVAKATERLLEEYKYVCWKHLGGDKYDVKIGDRVKGYRCERLSRAFLYMYIPPVLRALGVEDVKRYIPQPIRDIIVAEYNLLKEYFRRAL